MTVEILFQPGCPNYAAVARSVKAALADFGASEEIELKRIATYADAEHERFLGSPTVRIDGRDVDPAAGDRDDFGLTCRLYRSVIGTTGVPPQDWIIAAIARARQEPG